MRHSPGSRISWTLALTATLLGGVTAGTTVDSVAALLGDRHLIACAPGYPGSAEQAQPTMDAFAAMVAAAAGWPEGSLSAEYTTDEEAGAAAIAAAADLVVVPLPFFLARAEQLELLPLVQAVHPDGGPEVWSLVAGRSQIAGPADLAGWELAGVPGYAPAFVRGPLLGAWGELPESVEIAFTDRALAALRRAMAGEPVAVLLDRAQTEALDSLPGADALEIVARSAPMPPLLVAVVGARLPEPERSAVRDGLLHVHEAPRFAEVLDTLRLSRFEPLDDARLEQLRAAYRARS